MLDGFTAPTVPVGAQWLGLARDIRRRVAVEDQQYDRAVAALILPVRERLHRYPHRALRPDMLVQLVQGWRFMPCRDWRLALDAKLDKHRASLVEHRIVAGVLRRTDDPDWTGREDDVACIRVELAVDRNTANLRSRCTTTFSLHAIARRLQRGQDGSIEALLCDMLAAAQGASGALVAGAGYRVRTHPDGGGWRGRVARHTQPDGGSFPVLALRTWLAD